MVGSPVYGIMVIHQEAFYVTGFHQGVTDVSDADMESAIKLLQRDYGLAETGIIDRLTLVALYYDQKAVGDALTAYPVFNE